MSHSFHNYFSRLADCYATFRPHYPAVLFDYLATLVPKSATVWDCACGSGQASLDLAARFEKVIATDASREQITSAMPHPKVDYWVAFAEQSGLANKSVALVTVAQAVHWFDFNRFYTEVNRVLTPHGVIAVWAYGINKVEGEDVNRIVEDFYSKTVGPYWPPERRMVEEGYRTIPFPFVELASPTFRMDVRWTLDQLLGYFSTWSATDRYLKVTGNDPIALLAAKLKLVWGDTESPRRVVWPVSTRVGRLGKPVG